MKEKAKIKKAIEDLKRHKLWLEAPPAVDNGSVYRLADSIVVAIHALEEKLSDIDEKERLYGNKPKR